ncbi:MAG: hypothetical protein JWL73_1187 [Actinomycetia bacterium]|nr:hypothetical protein [Actinomycetes bacterium]
MNMPAYPFDDLMTGRPVSERVQITDEAISAHVDGELAAFAADLGLDVADVTRRLEDWPGFETRRAELEASRAAIGALPAPELDELTRQRMLTAATRAGSMPPARATGRARPRSRVATRWTAISAAAAILVVGGAFVVLRGDHGDHPRRAVDAAAAAPAPLGYVGDLGDVTDPNALRAELARRLVPGDKSAGKTATPATTTTTPAASEQSNRAAASAPGLATGSTTTGNADDSSRFGTSVAPESAASRCAASIVSADAPGRTVLLTATGVYRGQPAAIVTIRRGGRTVTFIADLSTCAVIGGQSGGSG